jgi:hypothetical protein
MMTNGFKGLAVMAAVAAAGLSAPATAKADHYSCYYGPRYAAVAPVYAGYYSSAYYPRSYYYAPPVVYSRPVVYSAPVVYAPRPVVYSRPAYYPSYYGPHHVSFGFGYYGGHRHHRHGGFSFSYGRARRSESRMRPSRRAP